MKEKDTPWAEALERLKHIVDKTELKPEVKWGIDVYCYEGRNVLAFAGFKEHFAIWFYNGVFLKDDAGVLVNASEGKTKALRQWRMTSEDEIDEQLILAYIEEAIQHEKDGKVWTPEKNPMPEMHPLMQQAFEEDSELSKKFDAFTDFKKKEFIEYILEAKRESTKQNRLEKIKPMILRGEGLHDKYR